MDWMDSVNRAMQYIEENLDGVIDTERICRITASSLPAFQRFFALTTGRTLNDYIRRRRLSRAAGDLLAGGEKVIDVAVKYGYDSADAFSAAFKHIYGVRPSQVGRDRLYPASFPPIYFSLSITHLKGDVHMIDRLDVYRVREPLFEGARVVLNALGETYSPAYIQGISGAGFVIAGGCPSRPTCVCDMWTSDLLRRLGYEVRESPCADEQGEDRMDQMIADVRAELDRGRPVLVWNAFTNLEWDVAAGCDESQKAFIGRGSYRALEPEVYVREAWRRAGECDPAFGAIIVGEKLREPDLPALEREALENAVRRARNGSVDEMGIGEGLCFYRAWADGFRDPGRERDSADIYCYLVYVSARAAAVEFLKEIAEKYAAPAREHLLAAAEAFGEEVAALREAEAELSWESQLQADAEVNQALCGRLSRAADSYERAIGEVEAALADFRMA